jgi:hypothetical protein
VIAVPLLFSAEAEKERVFPVSKDALEAGDRVTMAGTGYVVGVVADGVPQPLNPAARKMTRMKASAAEPDLPIAPPRLAASGASTLFAAKLPV